MQLINLTPHKLNIMNGNNRVLIELESEGLARCEQEAEERPPIVVGGKIIGVVRMEYGQVYGLPDPVENVGFVVSAMVLNALPTRTDIFAPGELVRNSAGVVLGCQGLACNENYHGVSLQIKNSANAQVAVGVNNIQIGGSVGPGAAIGGGTVIASRISGKDLS